MGGAVGAHTVQQLAQHIPKPTVLPKKENGANTHLQALLAQMATATQLLVPVQSMTRRPV